MSKSLYHVFLFGFIITIHCTISVSEVCTCTQLKSEKDCQQNEKCQWIANACQNKQEGEPVKLEPESVYCKDFTQELCITKIGCAYFDKKCSQFSGCTSYLFTTHNECQLVSTQCTSDGIQCINPRECILNNTEPLCSTVRSSSGSKKCVWENNGCRDQKCTEASEYLNTDEACNSFIKGCITTGRGCTTQRVNCIDYEKDCEGMIGIDGECVTKGDKCQSKVCSDAPETYYEDIQCQKFRKGCRTTGIGCTDQALKSCNTYTGDSEKCLRYIGNSGKCEEGLNGKCQARKCENAPKKYSTDEQCKSYSPKCKTTGIGCVTILLNCNSYQGTKTDCEKRIGADGKCTGSDEQSQECKAKICSGGQFSTDSECAQYQYNCISNGVECTSRLINCNEYKGESEKCKKYIGLDGKCTEGVNGYCAVNPCESSQLKTNEECKSVQSYCLTNGVRCIKADTCPNTKWKVACLDNTKCQWSGQCVQNECRYFPTMGMCLQFSSKVECFWDGYSCVDKQCKHATPEQSKDCKTFLSNCVQNGQKCIDISAPCEEYLQVESNCSLFKGNNGKIQCEIDNNTLYCRSQTCQENTYAKSQDQCNSDLGCKFQGLSGCVNQDAECQEYYGNAKQCRALNPNCSQDPELTAHCRPLQCYDNTTALEDYECNNFKSGCVYRGIPSGCISSTSPCNQYIGNSKDDCSKFVGNNKKCWYDQSFPSQCVDKQCSHNFDAQSDSECETFLEGCVFNEKGCQDKSLTCDTYQGDEYKCQRYRGNGLGCVRIDYCEERQCSDVQNPISQKECEDYLESCAFDGANCIDKKSCNSYYGFTKESCQLLVGLDGDLCTYGEVEFQCAPRKCMDATNVKSQMDCTSYRKDCIFNGVDKCEEVQLFCSNYKGFSEEGCKEAKNKEGKGCWYNKDGQCRERDCTEQLSSYSTQICNQHHSSCIFTGLRCAKKQNSCSEYTTLSQSECRYLSECWKQADSDGPCSDRTCQDSVESPSDVNCRNHLGKCRYNGDSNCVDEQEQCSQYVNFTMNACKEVTNKNGQYCWYKKDSSDCVNRTCSDDLPQFSAEDCVQHLDTCRYYGIRCQDGKNACSDYTGFSKDACSSVTTLNNQACWYQGSSTICVNGTCNDYIKDASMENCKKHMPVCRYNGIKCMLAKSSCSEYIGSNELCKQLTDINNNQCWYDINGIQGSDNSCIKKECSNKQNIYDQNTCLNYIGQTVNNVYIPSCQFDGIKCIDIQKECSDYNKSQCLFVITSKGKSCFQDQNNNLCRERQCSDNKTAVNDLQCEQFLLGCRTNGKGCTKSTDLCSQYMGTKSSCLKFVGNGKKCKGVDTTSKCSVKECFHDQQSITDIECNSFMEGCVTNGKGCLSQLEPCESYTGNLETCSKFKGNGKLCYSDKIDQITTCRDRKCQDDTKSISDSDCIKFMPGCVSMGKGCIADTEPCSSYFGTQAECSRFNGEKGSKPCWNLSDATKTTRCINRECNHMQRATNDVECNSFLEGCVSDGFQCLTKRTCSQFYGSAKTCKLFNATDKPCKGIDNTIQQCKQLLCIDAPNNYDTDKKCDEFKSGCKTTGFGCTDKNTCDMISSKDFCKERADCQYIDGCLNNIQICIQITKYSQCLNNQNLKCSWDFQKKQCRDWICSDASVLLKKHEQCQELNKQCTTTGNGCIQISKCEKYTNKQTCLNAISLGYSKQCVWESNRCRDKVCEDAPLDYQTDENCQRISSECRTAGQGCTYKVYTCENLNLKDKCIQDSQNRPCLWLNKTQSCVTFSQCTDIIKTTQDECQLYSTTCTSNGDNCISFSKCSDYKNQISCQKGTDGVCGWVVGQSNETQRCQQFNKCQDIQRSTKTDCQQYSAQCTSDGVNCIDVGDCNSYKNEIACTSQIDCFWDDINTPSNCRTLKCYDIPIIQFMTHQYCTSFNQNLNCTTDGIQCIDKKQCKEYSESSCYEGTDGPCIFTFPKSQNTGTKQCRAKECLDYVEKTTEACSKLKPKCISDGIRCLDKLNCSEYNSQIACESDGTDGICVYNQTCSLMTQCQDANDSYTACSKQPKVCSFEYQNNSNTTTCAPISCSSSPNCSPFLNFNRTLMTVCIQKSQTECIEGEPYMLLQDRCYQKSLNTYTWNSNTNKCEKCVGNSVDNNTTGPDIYQVQLAQIVLALLFIAN